MAVVADQRIRDIRHIENRGGVFDAVEVVRSSRLCGVGGDDEIVVAAARLNIGDHQIALLQRDGSRRLGKA